MDEDLAIGDLGVVDGMGSLLDIPDPTIVSGDEAASMMASTPPGSPGASMVDMGFTGSAVVAASEEGFGGSFGGGMAEPAPFGEVAQGLPFLEPPPPAPAPPAFSEDGVAFAPSFPAAESGASSRADFTPSEEGFTSSLLGLPMLEAPLRPESPFAGIAAPPDEFLDLQMAMTPPEPSQEGFAAMSDAPFAAPAPAMARDSLPGSSGLTLAAAQAIASEAWSGSFGSGPSGAGGGRVGGSQVTIQNLHLPAANPQEFYDQMLAQSPDQTNADLSGLT